MLSREMAPNEIPAYTLVEDFVARVLRWDDGLRQTVNRERCTGEGRIHAATPAYLRYRGPFALAFVLYT